MPQFSLDLISEAIPIKYESNQENNIIVSILILPDISTLYNILKIDYFLDSLPNYFKSITNDITNKTGIILSPERIKIEILCGKKESDKQNVRRLKLLYKYLKDDRLIIKYNNKNGKLSYVDWC